MFAFSRPHLPFICLSWSCRSSPRRNTKSKESSRTNAYMFYSSTDRAALLEDWSRGLQIGSGTRITWILLIGEKGLQRTRIGTQAIKQLCGNFLSFDQALWTDILSPLLVVGFLLGLAIKAFSQTPSRSAVELCIAQEQLEWRFAYRARRVDRQHRKVVGDLQEKFRS